MRLLPLLLAGLWLGAPAAADPAAPVVPRPSLAILGKLPVLRAAEVADDAPRQRVSAPLGDTRLAARRLDFLVPRGGVAPAAAARQAMSSGRASFPHWSGFELWAAGAGYAVGRHSAGYGVEWGAALPLDRSFALTAGYRLTGFSRGDRLDANLGDVEQRIGAPFVGVDLEF